MTDIVPFTTKTFSTSPSTYLRCLAGMWFKRYGLWPMLAVLTCIALGILVDIRWIIVTMMMVFILIPMLMGFLYFYYMLTPEAQRAILPMSIDVHSDGSLTITYAPLPDSDKPPRAPEELPPRTVKRVVQWKNFKALAIESRYLSFILVPQSAVLKGE